MTEDMIIEDVWIMFLLDGYEVDDYETFRLGYLQYLKDAQNG
jgi:hypothetical protein